MVFTANYNIFTCLPLIIVTLPDIDNLIFILGSISKFCNKGAIVCGAEGFYP
jgi:hypothetical protein